MRFDLRAAYVENDVAELVDSRVGDGLVVEGGGASVLAATSTNLVDLFENKLRMTFGGFG